tara:strand:+ start:250 stop:450 length:201 start_codon:yes stop_codon:yes gene_type:complete
MKNIDLKNLLILGAVIILFVTTGFLGFSFIPFMGVFMGVGVVIPWLRKDEKPINEWGMKDKEQAGE